MKNNKMKTSKTQQGFAMLEVMLAVLIIAVASFGIYKLYSSSSDRNNVARTESIISQVSAASQRFHDTFMKAPAKLNDLLNSGLSQGLLTCDAQGGCTLPSPFGDITFTAPTDNQHFSLTITSMKASAIGDFAADMFVIADVKIGETAYKGDGTDAIPATDSNVTLTFPKTTA